MLKNKIEQIQIFDGATGTELSYLPEVLGAQGLTIEELNIDFPLIIKDLHRSYIDAGADYITTNTFGVNPAKWQSQRYTWKQVADAAIDNARQAAQNSSVKIFFDMSSSGRLMEPVGDFTFEECYANYTDIVNYTKSKVDGFILETFTDLYELKAAVLAVKDATELPLFATMTFDDTDRTMTGSTPEIVALTLSSLGVDALGVNCSTSPDKITGLVARMKPFASCPILVQPNKGLPEIRDNKVSYNINDQEFAYWAGKMIEAGASIIGGCCGTSPSTIRAISKYKGLQAPTPAKPDGTYICSSTILLQLRQGLVCGERLNPTGKKKLKAALAEGDFEYLQHEALAQRNAGADFLDLNVGVPNCDEKALLCQAVKKVQEVCDLPLQLDSSNPEALKAAIRLYNGVPMINSINGDENSLSNLLPLIAAFQTPTVTLPLDKDGIPETSKGRIAIAERIIARAAESGIDKRLLVMDALVMAISSNQEYGNTTLQTLAELKKLGVLTIIGLSNVSFGLPERAHLNRTFLAMALTKGLDIPIMNPLDHDAMEITKSFMALSGKDPGCQSYILFNTEASQDSAPESLYNAIVKGLKDSVLQLLDKELETNNKEAIINGILIPALEEVGVHFEKNEIFMPQLIRSAESAKLAFELLASRYDTSETDSDKGSIILATVKGDVHDIGKNIVKVVLQSHGYRVFDLGKNVDETVIEECYRQNHSQAIGLSALMTTTVDSMHHTIDYLRSRGINCPIIVGGAVLTEDIALSIGASYYSKDALQTARLMNDICK